MAKLIDLTNQRFGRLVVLEKANNNSTSTQAKWLCQCDCGKQKVIASQSLRKGITKSCGCLQKEITAKRSFKDLTGQTFGKLTVLYNTNKQAGSNYIWHCKCECGNECDVRGGDLANGHTSSCGCLTTSLGESRIAEILKQNNINYNSQHTFNDCRYKDTNQLVRFDFYLPDYNRIIEFDGIQHFQANGGWNNEKNYNRTKERDLFRNQWAAAHNISLVRIPYWEKDNITLEMLLGDKYLVG